MAQLIVSLDPDFNIQIAPANALGRNDQAPQWSNNRPGYGPDYCDKQQREDALERDGQ